jgi:hypothetical protein
VSKNAALMATPARHAIARNARNFWRRNSRPQAPGWGFVSLI